MHSVIYALEVVKINDRPSRPSAVCGNRLNHSGW
jgi:hypothetical protein